MSLVDVIVAGPPPRSTGVAMQTGGFEVSGPPAGGRAGTPSSVGAAYSCVNFIARTCGVLPRKIIRRGDRTREEVRTEEFRHIWGRPNPTNAAISFWETLFASTEGWGNGYAWKGRLKGVPYDEHAPWRGVRELWHVRPERASVGMLDTHEKGFILNGDLQAPYTAETIAHFPGISFDGVRGVSPVRAGATAHELSLFAERFGRMFFRNGSTLSGVLMSKAIHNPEAARDLMESFNKQHQGVDRSHLTGVIGGDATYERIGIPPNEAQFLETRQFQREEVVQFYGPIPHHLLGWKSNTSNFGTGIESQGIHVVVFVLLNRLRRVEQVANDELLPPDLELKFNVKGLLEGDMKTRAEFMRKLREMGMLSAEEGRALEEMPPRGIEDDYLTPGNMVRIPANGGAVVVPESSGRRRGDRGAGTTHAVVEEARCQNADCSSRRSGAKGALLGRNVSAADLRCQHCGETQRFGTPVAAVPPQDKDAPRDGLDFADRVLEDLAARL